MSGNKQKFLRRYPGPVGKHLMHLTETSMTGEYTEDLQKSIHPRVVNGRQVYQKVNTAK